jgi:hypothetical protein
MPLNDLDYNTQCIKTWNGKGNKKFPPLSNILKTLYERPLDNYSKGSNHYNNMGLFCDPEIIANNKERSFRKPAFTNHNSSQTVKPLRYHNICTRTIASPSQLPNLIQSQNFYDYKCFYIPFAIKITSKTICNKPIAATT